MTAPTLPDDVRRLISDYIPSVERLEVLLLLYEGRQRSWTVEELEEQIRSTPESIRQNASAIVAAGLAIATGTMPTTVQFQAAADALEKAVGTLAQLYRLRRVAVIEAIYAERHGEAQSFSDAFKLRKPNDR